jgi:hypothetical protein
MQIVTPLYPSACTHTQKVLTLEDKLRLPVYDYLNEGADGAVHKRRPTQSGHGEFAYLIVTNFCFGGPLGLACKISRSFSDFDGL